MVVLWKSGMPWTDVPEAAVYKHGYPRARECEIGCSGNTQMPPPPRDAVMPKQPEQPQLGPLVTTAFDPRHYFGTLGFGENVAHRHGGMIMWNPSRGIRRSR
jgi:hypothetical protein